MSEDTRTFEEIKAEQDALWAEIDSKPAPPGYDEWVRAQVQEALEDCDKPGAVFYSEEQVAQIMEEQKRLWELRERKTA